MRRILDRGAGVDDGLAFCASVPVLGWHKLQAGLRDAFDVRPGCTVVSLMPRAPLLDHPRAENLLLQLIDGRRSIRKYQLVDDQRREHPGASNRRLSLRKQLGRPIEKCLLRS